MYIAVSRTHPLAAVAAPVVGRGVGHGKQGVGAGAAWRGGLKLQSVVVAETAAAVAVAAAAVAAVAAVAVVAAVVVAVDIVGPIQTE